MNEPNDQFNDLTTGDVLVLGQKLMALEERVKELSNRQQITDVLYRYCRGADRCDAELMESCFWPDATDNHGFREGAAKDFVTWAMGVLSQLVCSKHSITNILIEWHGDRALVESQATAMHRIPNPDGSVIDNLNEVRYIDVFECREGEWRIQHRQCVHDSSRMVPVSAKVAEFTRPWGSGNNGARKPDDPLYHGLDVVKLRSTCKAMEHLWEEVEALCSAEARSWSRKP